MQFHFRKERKVNDVLRCLDSLSIPYIYSVYGEDHVIKFDSLSWVDDCYTIEREKKYPEFLYRIGDCPKRDASESYD